MPYIGPWYRCRRCHEVKPFTKRYFCECNGKLMQPCKQCAKLDKQQAPKPPKREYHRDHPRPAKGYPYLRCSDGVWRRIIRTDERDDNEPSN